jgi:hypothetical protein
MAETATRFVGSNSRNSRDGQFGIIWPKMTAALLASLVGAVAASSKPVRARANLSNKINLMLAVQSPLQKYFASPVGQIISTNSRHPTPPEGRIAIVTDAGCGCGGRGSVLRAMGSQGGSRDL